MVRAQWQNCGTILRVFQLGHTQYCLCRNLKLYAKCLLAKANCNTTLLYPLEPSCLNTPTHKSNFKIVFFASGVCWVCAGCALGVRQVFARLGTEGYLCFNLVSWNWQAKLLYRFCNILATANSRLTHAHLCNSLGAAKLPRKTPPPKLALTAASYDEGSSKWW